MQSKTLLSLINDNSCRQSCNSGHLLSRCTASWMLEVCSIFYFCHFNVNLLPILSKWVGETTAHVNFQVYCPDFWKRDNLEYLFNFKQCVPMAVLEIIFIYSEDICPFKSSFWSDIWQIGPDIIYWLTTPWRREFKMCWWHVRPSCPIIMWNWPDIFKICSDNVRWPTVISSTAW